jgi:hypothetical protein
MPVRADRLANTGLPEFFPASNIRVLPEPA